MTDVVQADVRVGVHRGDRQVCQITGGKQVGCLT